MSKESIQFDLEERMIDFAAFVASIKTANQNEKKTSSFDISCSIFGASAGSKCSFFYTTQELPMQAIGDNPF